MTSRVKIGKVVRTALHAFVLVPFVTCGAVNAKGGDPGRQDPSRVEKISGWLSERPWCEGRPISDRAAWDALARTDAGQKRIREAERAMADAPVVLSDEDYLDINRSGNRSRYQRQFNQHGGNFEKLVLAECLENKGRFLPAITNYLAAILAERSWVLPAHDRKLSVFYGKKCYVDLASCERALMLALASRWLEDRLTAAEHERIRSECRRRIFDPFLASARDSLHLDPDHWWYRGALNWNSVCHSATVRAALMLVEDRRERAEFVESAERGVKVALGGYTDDGYCPEGMGYWNYGWGWQLRLAVAVREATGGKVDLCADPKCRRVMEYANGNLLTPMQVPNYADGGGGRPESSALVLGRRIWPDLRLCAFTAPKPLEGGLGLIALLDFADDLKAPEALPLPRQTWFPQAEVYLGRATTAKKASFAFSVKGGNNGDSRHSHNDVGSWHLCFADEFVAGDPIPSMYTGNTFGPNRYDNPVIGSYAHPVPLVAGRTQEAGARFAAKVLKTEFSDAKDTVVLDLSGAYSVTNLAALVRTVTFDRTACSVRIADKVRFSAPSDFEVPIVTYQDVRADYDRGHFTLDVPKKGVVDVRLSAAGGDWHIKSELVFNPLRSSAKRLALAFDRPVREAEVVTVLSVLQ